MSLTSFARLGRQFISVLNPERTLLVCVIVGCVFVVLRSIPLVASPYQIDYGEGLMLDGALRLRHSQPLYPNPFAFPVVLHVYGPVAYGVTRLILPGEGVSFPEGRLLIMMCAVAVSWLLAFILRRLTGSWRIGASFGFLLLTLPAFRFWLYLLRADVIGVLFSIIGMALYLLGKKYWCWSIPFFGLALFCKYSLLAAPVAVFIHLLVNRKIRRGGLFVVGLGTACATAFTVLQIKTSGWFAFHMFSTHPDRYSLLQFLALGGLVLASAPVVTALAAWYVAQDFRGKAFSFLPIYLVAASASALTAGKLGSTTNHFIEWMVACCLCAGMGYSLLLSRYLTRALPITILLSVTLLVGVAAQDRPNVQPSREMTECGAAYRYVGDSASSRILSENLGPLLVAGKPILVSDPFVYDQFLKHGLWPDSQVESLLRNRYFDLIVMTYDPSQARVGGVDTWLAPLATVIERNYKVVRQFDCRDARIMLQPIPPGYGP